MLIGKKCFWRLWDQNLKFWSRKKIEWNCQQKLIFPTLGGKILRLKIAWKFAKYFPNEKMLKLKCLNTGQNIFLKYSRNGVTLRLKIAQNWQIRMGKGPDLVWCKIITFWVLLKKFDWKKRDQKNPLSNSVGCLEGLRYVWKSLDPDNFLGGLQWSEN